jgi:hypothetical protein
MRNFSGLGSQGIRSCAVITSWTLGKLWAGAICLLKRARRSVAEQQQGAWASRSIYFAGRVASAE